MMICIADELKAVGGQLLYQQIELMQTIKWRWSAHLAAVGRMLTT